MLRLIFFFELFISLTERVWCRRKNNEAGEQANVKFYRLNPARRLFGQDVQLSGGLNTRPSGCRTGLVNLLRLHTSYSDPRNSLVGFFKKISNPLISSISIRFGGGVTSLCIGEGKFRKFQKLICSSGFTSNQKLLSVTELPPWVRRGRSQIYAQKLPSLCVVCKLRPVFLCWGRVEPTCRRVDL